MLFNLLWKILDINLIYCIYKLILYSVKAWWWVHLLPLLPTTKLTLEPKAKGPRREWHMKFFRVMLSRIPASLTTSPAHWKENTSFLTQTAKYNYLLCWSSCLYWKITSQQAWWSEANSLPPTRWGTSLWWSLWSAMSSSSSSSLSSSSSSASASDRILLSGFSMTVLLLRLDMMMLFRVRREAAKRNWKKDRAGVVETRLPTSRFTHVMLHPPLLVTFRGVKKWGPFKSKQAGVTAIY